MGTTKNGPFSIAMLNYQRVRRMFLWNKYPTAENLHQVVQALAETNSAERLRETQNTQPVACRNGLDMGPEYSLESNSSIL